jgi:hypothetical protein
VYLSPLVVMGGLARNVYVRTHIFSVSSCPAAHASKWCDDRSSKLAQRILDSDGLRPGHAPDDQASGFEVAKSSGQHTLRHASELAAQFSMPVRPLLQREQNLGRPCADKNRGRRLGPWTVVLFLVDRSFRSRYNLVLAAHKTNLRPDIEEMRVTNVAGFGWTR